MQPIVTYSWCCSTWGRKPTLHRSGGWISGFANRNWHCKEKFVWMPLEQAWGSAGRSYVLLFLTVYFGCIPFPLAGKEQTIYTLASWDKNSHTVFVLRRPTHEKKQTTKAKSNTHIHTPLDLHQFLWYVLSCLWIYVFPSVFYVALFTFHYIIASFCKAETWRCFAVSWGSMVSVVSSSSSLPGWMSWLIGWWLPSLKLT